MIQKLVPRPVSALFDEELQALLSSDVLVAGVDEAGRGPWVGPVVAAAVILDPARPIEGLADSKKLTEKKRDQLELEIKARALSYCVQEASIEEIDALNILQATLLAMRRAVLGLSATPQVVLVDGNRPPQLPMRVLTLVGGDDYVPAIQAASILAKVHRDRWCHGIDKEFPGYGFASHKGYGTAQHQRALLDLGVTPWHRKTFAPVAKVLAKLKGIPG
jgi:ribonuclease HII